MIAILLYIKDQKNTIKTNVEGKERLIYKRTSVRKKKRKTGRMPVAFSTALMR